MGIQLASASGALLERAGEQVRLLFKILGITFFTLPFCPVFFIDAVFKRNLIAGKRLAWAFVALSLLIAGSWRFILFGLDKGATRYWLFPGYLLIIFAGYGIARIISAVSGGIKFLPFSVLSITVCSVILYLSCIKLFRDRNNTRPQQILIDRVCKAHSGSKNLAVIFHDKIDPRLRIPPEIGLFSTEYAIHENNTLSEIQALTNYRTVFHIFHYKLGREPSVLPFFRGLTAIEASRTNGYYLCRDGRGIDLPQHVPWTILTPKTAEKISFSSYAKALLAANKLREELFEDFETPPGWTINIGHMWGEHCYPFSSKMIGGKWKIASRDMVNFYFNSHLPALGRSQCISVSVRASSASGALLGVGIYPASKNYTMLPAMPVNEEREMLFFIPYEATCHPNPRLFIFSKGAVDISGIGYRVLKLSDVRIASDTTTPSDRGKKQPQQTLLRKRIFW